MPHFDFSDFAEKLTKSLSFPTVYMFKFIIKYEHRAIARLENIFGEEAELSKKFSSEGKYVSITAKQVVTKTEDIIDIYKKANEIEGVIWL